MSHYQFIKQIAATEPAQVLCCLLTVSVADYQWRSRAAHPVPPLRAELLRILVPVLVFAGGHGLVLEAHTRAIAMHLSYVTHFIFAGATHNAPGR